MTALRSFFIAWLALILWAQVAHAQLDLNGQTESGAFYRFMVPDGWLPADGLVIWNHGFSLEEVGPVDDLGPLADLHLNQGYAVAASSYSLKGWAVFQTLLDTQQMTAAFEAMFGAPDRIFIYGASLGGLVTLQALEEGGLGNVVGALPLCGALAGSRNWDLALDLRLTYDAVCGEVPGAAIDGGAGGLPEILDPSFDGTALAVAVNACTGILLPEAQRTSEQQARLDRILDTLGLPESFLLTDMSFATFGLHDLVFDPAKLAGAQAMDNRGVVYPDPALDADIERVTPEVDARRHLEESSDPTGAVGGTKIMSIHTDKDGLVVVENESEYQALAPPAQWTVGVVAEAAPSHCAFTEAEVRSAWELLQAWTDGAPQPTATDLQNTCQDLENTKVAAGPCRYDPSFVIPDLDDRVQPRVGLFFDGFESGDFTRWGDSQS